MPLRTSTMSENGGLSSGSSFQHSIIKLYLDETQKEKSTGNSRFKDFAEKNLEILISALLTQTLLKKEAVKFRLHYICTAKMVLGK